MLEYPLVSNIANKEYFSPVYIAKQQQFSPIYIWPSVGNGEVISAIPIKEGDVS